MRSAIDAVREGFVALSADKVDQPERLALADGSLLAMAARVDGRGAVAKVVSVTETNRRVGLPTVQALVIWFEESTGEPIAIIDGAAVTALRTGAASGVATDLMAPVASSTLAMIGVGDQAPDQINAVVEVRPIREIRVASRSVANARNFIAAVGESYPDVTFHVTASPAEAVHGADVICTATTSLEPLLHLADIPARCHINAVGAYRPDMCEVSGGVLAAAHTIAVDQIAAALTEAGDIIQGVRSGAIDVADLVDLGTLLESGFQRDGITVFKSVGVAVQDWAVAAIAVARAQGIHGRDQTSAASGTAG
jgi:ornithine cyclodeaminase